MPNAILAVYYDFSINGPGIVFSSFAGKLLYSILSLEIYNYTSMTPA